MTLPFEGGGGGRGHRDFLSVNFVFFDSVLTPHCLAKMHICLD